LSQHSCHQGKGSIRRPAVAGILEFLMVFDVQCDRFAYRSGKQLDDNLTSHRFGIIKQLVINEVFNGERAPQILSRIQSS
jgi:hypothetical protein